MKSLITDVMEYSTSTAMVEVTAAGAAKRWFCLVALLRDVTERHEKCAYFAFADVL